VQIRFVPNDSARVAALLAGDVDVIDTVPTGLHQRIREAPTLQLVNGYSVFTHYFYMDAMSAQVQATLDGQKALLAGLAHDLRTPITALRLRSAMVEDGEARARIEASLDELSALTEAALEAARAGGDGERPRAFDLAALADSVCQDLAEMGLAAAFADGPAAPVNAKLDATRRALRNLIENAVRYGGGARVRTEAAGGLARVIVEDDGPGIPEADLARVFDPFVRLEASRSQDTGGHGLGLTIARLALRAQGGDVTLRNRPEGGLQAILSLPYPGAV
jgi:signal transduction histidine kinase